MGFQLKAREIEQRLLNSNKGNCININGSIITSGEFILYNKEEENAYSCGKVIDIKDFRDIPREERSNCGLPLRVGKNIASTTRYALIMEIVTREGIKNPKLNAVKYPTVPQNLNEAIPAHQLTYIRVESAQ